MFWAIVFAIASFVLQLLLIPKPQNAKPASLDDFQVPTAEEGIEISVLFGTKVLKAPNVVWHGHFRRVAIEGDRQFGFFGPRQIIGYKYFLGMHMILCHGPADYLYKVFIRDTKVLFNGLATGGPITVNKPKINGADLGGIRGTFDLEMGYPDQDQNAYLLARHGEQLPGFRGVVGIVLNRMYLGNSPYLQPWSFLLQRIYVKSDGTEQWYPEKAAIRPPITAKQVRCVLTWWQRVNSPDLQLDQARMGLEFLDINDDPIAPITWAALTSPTIWTQRTIDTTSPEGTFKVRIQMEMRRSIGFNNDGYIDDIRIRFDGEDSPIVNPGGEVAPYETSPNAGPNPPGWITDVQVGIRVKEKTSESNSHSGNYYFAGKAAPTCKARQDVFIGDINYDMNPAHIIRELLTDRMWGMGYNESDIDDVSFTYAADLLYDERFGLTFLWVREEVIEEFITVVLSHIDAVLYVSRETGKFILKLIRDDYDSENLPILTEDDINSWVEVSRRQPAEAVNAVIVKHYDIKTKKDSSKAVFNIAQINQLGNIVSVTRNYPGITHGDLAVRVATRDVKSLGIGFINAQLNAKRTAEFLNPGDPFRLVSERHNILGEVMRVVDLDFGDGRTNEISMKVTQDIFSLGENIIVDSPPVVGEPPVDLSSIEPRMAYEMPYYEMINFIGQADVDSNLGLNPDFGLAQMAAGDSDVGVVGVDLYINPPDDSGYVEIATIDLVPTAALNMDITFEDITVDITDLVNVFDEEEGLAVQLGSLALIEQELVRVDAVTETTLTMGRGCLDTIPVPHIAGTKIMFYGNRTTLGIDSYTSGDTIGVKMVPISTEDALDVSDVAEDLINFDSRAFRPLRNANVKVQGVGYGTISGEGLSEFAVTWNRRNRLTELTPLDWFDPDVEPEYEQTTVIEVLDADQTLLTTHDNIVGTSFNVPLASLDGNSIAKIRVSSERDGYRSFNFYELEVLIGEGYGYAYGFNYGGASGSGEPMGGFLLTITNP